jgi:hypothetical protein
MTTRTRAVVALSAATVLGVTGLTGPAPAASAAPARTAADFDGDGRPDLFVGELGDPNGNHKHEPAIRIFFNRAGRLVVEVIDRGITTHEAKVIELDGRTCVVGKPYRNIDATAPRQPWVDSVHLWTPASVKD